MRTTWKFSVDPDKSQPYVVSMPTGATIFRVAGQGGKGRVYFWAFIDTAAPLVSRTFEICGTGHPVDDLLEAEAVYVGSADCPPFVWHLFELVSRES